MNWAWGIQLPPTIKLILMSLADNADDTATCFPSVKYIAQRCCVSQRTVRRAIRELQRLNLLTIQPQFRKDGSNTSNLYVLALHTVGDVNLSPPKVGDSNMYGQRCKEGLSSDAGHGDKRDTPLIYIEPPDEQPTTTLEKPKFLQEAEFNSILRLAHEVEPVVVQDLLDEMEGHSKSIANPVGYFRTLLTRHSKGEFFPSTSIQVQRSKAIRKRNALVLARSDELGCARLARLLKQKEAEHDG